MQVNENAILGLDIGSSKICAIIAEIDHHHELHLKGVGTSISSGLKRGKISDASELQKALERAITRAEQNAYTKPIKVITNLPFYQMRSDQIMGIITSQDESGQISESDRISAIEQAKFTLQLTDKKIIHLLPIKYIVDNKQVQNPIGVFGSHLEVHIHTISANFQNLMSLVKIIRKLNLQISGIVYDPLATAQILIPESQKQAKVYLLDIGSNFTKLSLYQNHNLQHTTVIPIGGEQITKDISHCLQVSIPEAERLKILQTDLILKRIDPNQKLEINTKNKGRISIKKLYLNQIIEARVSELLTLLQSRFNLPINQKTPLILLGQSSQLIGLSQYISEKWKIKIQETIPPSLKSIIDNISYISALGNIVYGLKSNAIQYIQPVKENIFLKFIKKFIGEKK